MYCVETGCLVKIEEVFNELMRDEKIRKLRTALVDFVVERLQERVRTYMNQAGLDQEMEQKLLAGQQVEIYPLLQRQSDMLKLSQNQLRELKRIEKVDRLSAWEYLLDVLLEKEKVQFRKDAGLSAKVWLSFLNHTVLPGNATLDKIQAHLGLNPEQQMEFDRRVIRYVFQVDRVLRDTVQNLRKKTGMTLTEFLKYACIGKEAWEAFYPVSGDPSKMKKTSQDTLLKLVIGFGLEEPEAWEFMDTAKSTFVVRRDLVVLSCIRCCLIDPYQVQQILEFFAEGKNGERYYTNPYD